MQKKLLCCVLLCIHAVLLHAADDLILTTSVLSDYNGEDVSCVDECDGVAIVNPTGGIPPYNYSWSDGQTTQVAIGLCAGMYIVTVTDQTPCSVTDTVFLLDPPALTVDTDPFEFLGGFNVSCPGFSDGQIMASASGGVGGYSYLWSDGQTGPNAVGLGGGLIFVVATDNNGCQVIDSVDMLEPPAISAGTSIILDVSCSGRVDGFIDLNMTGGSGSFSYAWDDGPVSPIRSGLNAGTYEVTVTDILGCDFDTAIEITKAPPVILTLEDVLYTTCPNSADGAIDISVNGGSPPYSYVWSHGVTTQDVTGLTRDKYYVTVSDTRGCYETQPVSVGSDAKLRISSLKVNPSCGMQDGAINLNVQGADGDVSYIWDDGTTTSTRENLEAGVYEVTVMDTVCMYSRKFQLSNSDSFEIAATVIPAICGTSTGSATADPVNGVAPYTWQWSDGQSTQTAATLSSGAYDVEITDARGCKAVAGIRVQENNNLALDAAIMKPSFCAANDGSILLTPMSGAMPYTYQWSTGETGNSITGVRSGIYLATVQDAAGCIDTARIAVEDDSDLSVDVVTTPSACVNWTGGAIAMPSGGTAPYRHTWATGDTSDMISGLPLGMGFVYVRDAAGCLDINGLLIPGSFGVRAEADVYGVSCNALDDGSIDLSVLSGLPEFEYNWNTGASTQDLEGLTLGDLYTVQVLDSAGCNVSGDMIIGDGCEDVLLAVDDTYQAVEAAVTSLPVTENDIAPTRSDITVSVLTAPAQGSASAESDLSVSYTAPAAFNGADSFTYILCNGIGTCDTALVLLSVVPEFVIPDAFSPNQDGVNDFFDIRGILEFPDNQLTIFNRWGTEVFAASGYDGTWDGTGPSGNALPEGTYFYSLTLGGDNEDYSGYFVIRR